MHEKPAGEFIVGSNDAYTVTVTVTVTEMEMEMEMEILHPLSDEEKKLVSFWYAELIGVLRSEGGPATVQDPYELT